jgi:hypothetical protein
VHDRPFAAIGSGWRLQSSATTVPVPICPGAGSYPGSVSTITILEMSLFVGALSSDPYEVEDAR